MEGLDRGVEAGRPGKIRRLLGLLRRDGVEGAIRSDLLDRGRSLDELGRTLAWHDLDAWLEHLPGRSAFRQLVDPMGIFYDPEIARLAALEDQVADLGHMLAGTPPEQRPAGVASRTRAMYAAAQARPKAPTAAVIDVRAELAARQRGESPKSRPRKPNPEAQRIRAALAERMAAAAQ